MWGIALLMMAFGERTQVTEPASVFLWQKSLWGVKHLACLSVVATSKTGLGVHCPEAQLEGEIKISAPYCLVFPKVVVLVLRPVMQTLTWSFKLEKLYFSHLNGEDFSHENLYTVSSTNHQPKMANIWSISDKFLNLCFPFQPKTIQSRSDKSSLTVI